jgi:hypothetical protein
VRASSSWINKHARKRGKPVSLLIHADQRAASLYPAISYSNVIRRRLLFGKAGEMASKHQKDLELSMLCLHLLQISMVYINTLMIQQILAERSWTKRLTKEDL